jgi:hypothetical protein
MYVRIGARALHSFRHAGLLLFSYALEHSFRHIRFDAEQ